MGPEFMLPIHVDSARPIYNASVLHGPVQNVQIRPERHWLGQETDHTIQFTSHDSD